MRPQKPYVLDRPHVVYRAYAADGTLLYVGCTARIAHRLHDHSTLSRWWPLAVRIDQQEYPSFGRGAAVEAAAIRQEDPICNVIGRTGGPTAAKHRRDAYLDAHLPSSAAAA